MILIKWWVADGTTSELPLIGITVALNFLAVVFAATTIIHFARDCGRLVRSTVRRAGFAFGVSVENYKDW